MAKKKICVGGFIMREQTFLFGKRAEHKTWSPGLWDIIGGHAHKHEDIYEALKRETLEEVGITVQSAELLSITDVWDKQSKNFFEYYIYMITSFKGHPRNCSDEHIQIGWFTLNELQSMHLALPIYTSLLQEWMTS